MIKQVQPESYDADSDDGNGYRYAYDACGRMTEVQDPGEHPAHLRVQRARTDPPGSGRRRKGGPLYL